MTNLADLEIVGSITTLSGKIVTLKVQPATLMSSTLLAAIDGVADGAFQALARPDDMRSPAFSHYPVAAKIVAMGGTHAAKLGYGKTQATLALAEADAKRLIAILDEANTRANDQDAADETARWVSAEAACPAGFVPASIKWTNGDLCARGVVTRDGIETTVSDTCETHAGYVWVPTPEVETKRAAKMRGKAAAEVHQAALLTAEVPAQVLAAFRRYGGDAEKAWAAEDEMAWAAINRHGPAIEAQGLGFGPVEFERRVEDSIDHQGE